MVLYGLINDFPRLSERVEVLSEKLDQLDQAHIRIKVLEAANHDFQRRLKPLESAAAVAMRRKIILDVLKDPNGLKGS